MFEDIQIKSLMSVYKLYTQTVLNNQSQLIDESLISPPLCARLQTFLSKHIWYDSWSLHLKHSDTDNVPI